MTGRSRNRSMNRRIKAVLGLSLAAVALTTATADGRYWVIRGHGFGHGVGMSSYGTYGFARHGRTYGQMLHHYYRGTHLGHVKGRSVKVLLSAGSGAVTFSKANAARVARRGRRGAHLRPREHPPRPLRPLRRHAQPGLRRKGPRDAGDRPRGPRQRGEDREVPPAGGDDDVLLELGGLHGEHPKRL